MNDFCTAILFLTIPLILFSIVALYPLFQTIYISLYDLRGFSKPSFIGYDNYENLFHDVVFRKSLTTTLIWSLSTTALSVSIGWMLAMLCAFAPRATLVPRIMIFSAYVMSESVAGFIWLGVFRPDDGGLLNGLLIDVGLGNLTQAWLGNPWTALAALIITAAWTQTGLNLMICFSATQAIPRPVVEAALMDGTRPWSMIRHILMPLSRPGARIATFITLLSSLRAFDAIYVLTAGGPMRSTETVGFFMYRESMQQFKLGYGAAATVVLLMAVLVVSSPALARRVATRK